MFVCEPLIFNSFFNVKTIALMRRKAMVFFCVLSRCSKLFYIILSKYFYFASRSQASPQHSSCKQACFALHSVCTDIALRSCTAFVCPALSHIARYAPLLRQVRLHLSIAHASKLASLCIRFALTFAQNKQLRHNNAIQM